MRIFEWNWCPLPEHIKAEHRRIVRDTLEKLMERGPAARSLHFEKLHGFPKSIGPIFSIRYNDEGRIIISSRVIQGKTYWGVLAVLAKHEYDAFIRYLKSFIAHNPTAWEQFFKQAKPAAHAAKGLEPTTAAETSDSEDDSSIPLPTGDANEPWSFEEISYFGGHFIISDEDQGRVVQQEVQLPLVLEGFAGSGKTSTAVRFLQEALRNECSRLLYVARSRELVAKIKRDFERDIQLEENLGSAAAPKTEATRSSIEFLTYAQLLSQLFGDAELQFNQDEQAGKKAFQDWVGHVLQRNHLSPRAVELLRQEAEKVYLEFRIISGFRQKYLEIGTKGALFSRGEAGDRALLLTLFRDFEQYLAELPQKISEFYFRENIQPRFTTIVFDEAGGETTASLLLAARLASNQNIIFCFDPRQVFENRLSDMHLMNVLLGRPVHHHHLRRVYRCTPEMAEVAAKVHELRALFAPNTKAAGEFIVPSVGEHLGGVELIPLEDKAALTRVQGLSRDAHFCVLTYPEYLQEATKRFSNTVVLPVDHARGLEFRMVAFYKPFGPRVFSDINKQIDRAEHGVTAEHLEFTEYLSLLFIGMTRPEQFLFLLDDFSQRRIRHLMDFLRPTMRMAQGAVVQAEESTETEWELRAIQYLQQGFDGLATDILKNRLKRTPEAIDAFVAQHQSVAASVKTAGNAIARAEQAPDKESPAAGKAEDSKKKVKKSPPKSKGAPAPAGASQTVHPKSKPSDDMSFKDFLAGLYNRNLDPNRIRILLQKHPSWVVYQTADLYKTEDQGNLLSFAIRAGNPLPVIEALIKAGVNIHYTNDINVTPLHVACRFGKLDVVTKLLDLGANIEVENVNGDTPLFYASEDGYLSIVQELIRRKANIAKRNKKGNTVLHFATSRGHVKIVEELLGAGAVTDEQNNDNITALNFAAVNGYASIVRLLLDKGASVSRPCFKGATALHAAVQQRHISVVVILLAEKANVDARTNNGCTPLILASENGDLPIVEALLREKPDVDAVDNIGHTALIQASLRGHHLIVKTLLRDGASIGIRSKAGISALYGAVSGNYLAIVEELLAAGAPVNERISFGCTLLHIAAQQGDGYVVRALIDRGADIDARDNEGKTPLYYYTQSEDNISVLNRLLEAGASVNKADNEGKLPIHIAKKLETINILLQKSGSDYNAHLKILLGRVCKESFVELLAFLMKKYPDLNPLHKEPGTSLTPFLLACTKMNEPSKNESLDQILSIMLKTKLSSDSIRIKDEDAMAGLRLVCITNNINRAIVFLNHRPQMFSVLYREKPELVKNIHAQLPPDKRAVLSDQVPNLKGAELAAVGGKPLLPSGGPEGARKEESATGVVRKEACPETRKRAVG